MKQALLVFTMKRIVILLFIMIISAPVSYQHPIRSAEYDLIYITDATTELTGSIQMLCRTYATAENIRISEVQFWLNSTTCNITTSLRQRDDVKVSEVDNYNIKFNLTHSLEGYYTCGKQVDENCIMSTKRELISLQTLVPIPDTGVIQSYTALLGGRVDLQCPIQPGALQQHYSVIWTKNDIEIASSLSIGKSESRYNIDRATYALSIDPVDEGDTSSSYQYQVFVTNPITHTKQQLQHYASGVQLSLRVEPAYELIYKTDATTELTGSITMLCRSFTTAENISISEVQFWLNYTTCNNTTSLRQRDDVNVLEVDSYSIKFNLTRSLEGYYTCGKQIDENCIMSTEKELISLQTLIPMPDTGGIQNYTAPLGGRVECPIQPGALQQYYSVIWTKDDAEIGNSQSIGRPESRYNIDRATYALVINPVDEGDTSSSYQCQVFVTNPITNTKQQLQHHPQLASGVQLSLKVEPAYELIYRTDATTELTGSITMLCRSFTTAENVPISEVQFWLNYTTCNNTTSLRQREDINVLEVDSYSIKFNLTRSLEGYYTCGKQVNENCIMSTERELISPQTLIPMPDTGVIQSYTASLGGRVDLQCPIQPGALQQHYSVIWMKDDVKIANSQSIGRPESRYEIDRATYALSIDPVNENDTSSSYQCQVFVTNPITNSKQQLQHHPQLASGVYLSLRVEAAYDRTDATTELTGSIRMLCRSFTTAENIPMSEVQFWLNCTHNWLLDLVCSFHCQ